MYALGSWKMTAMSVRARRSAVTAARLSVSVTVMAKRDGPVVVAAVAAAARWPRGHGLASTGFADQPRASRAGCTDTSRSTSRFWPATSRVRFSASTATSGGESSRESLGLSVVEPLAENVDANERRGPVPQPCGQRFGGKPATHGFALRKPSHPSRLGGCTPSPTKEIAARSSAAQPNRMVPLRDEHGRDVGRTCRTLIDQAALPCTRSAAM